MKYLIVGLILSVFVVACGDQTAEQQGRADYFTFYFRSDDTVSARRASANTAVPNYYYYVPWSHKYFSEFEAGCGYYGFDFEGSVLRSLGSEAPVIDPDPADSDWNTYLQYRGDSTGVLLCNGFEDDWAEGRFEYNRDTIIFQGDLSALFTDPGAIEIPADPGDRDVHGFHFILGRSWVLMHGTDTVDYGSSFLFWPYEYSRASALRGDPITGPDVSRVGLKPQRR